MKNHLATNFYTKESPDKGFEDYCKNIEIDKTLSRTQLIQIFRIKHSKSPSLSLKSKSASIQFAHKKNISSFTNFNKNAGLILKFILCAFLLLINSFNPRNFLFY